MFINPYDGFRRVKFGRFAFFCEEPTANRVIGKLFRSYEICQTIKLSLHRNEPGALVLKKLSPFRERFIINLLWMKEVGIFYKIYRHWNAITPICRSSGHFESVRFEYLAPIFLFIVFSHILSLIILFFEIYFDKWRKSIRRKFQRIVKNVIIRRRKF